MAVKGPLPPIPLTVLTGFLFGWIVALGARTALAESHRECSRCRKSLDDVPREGRAH